MNPVYLQLGKLGDLCSVLEIAYLSHLEGRRATIICDREFSDLLTGQSYADVEETHCHPDNLLDILPHFRDKYGDALRVCQSWRNPDQEHQTDSWQKEIWRRAGVLEKFGTGQLVFDLRSKVREAELVAKHLRGKPMVLVATRSPSSPFVWGEQLVDALTKELSETHDVIDLSQIQAAMPYDLLGLLGRAALLVTVDTFHLHLSRASTCPVIAIVNDVGTSATPGSWTASVAPPQAVQVSGYSGFSNPHEIDWIVRDAEDALQIGNASPKIYHAVDLYGDTPRHRRAQYSWDGMFETSRPSLPGRTSRDIGDSRCLPFLKDLLEPHLEGEGNNIVFWCNSDNALSPKLPEFLRQHVSLYGACSFRRTEEGMLGVHCGREGFAFTKRWLRENFDAIPDYLLGFNMFDIGLAALIRKQRGIVTTKANLTTDFFPADIGTGYVFHEPHQSEWAKDEGSPGNVYNRQLFAAWSKIRLPHLKFDANFNILK